MDKIKKILHEQSFTETIPDSRIYDIEIIKNKQTQGGGTINMR